MPVPTTHRLYAADPGAFAAIIEAAPDPRVVQSAPGSIFWVYTTPGGARLTDLYGADEDPTQAVVADTRGFIPFYALKDQGTLWVRAVINDTPTGGFVPVFPADVASDAVTALVAATSALTVANAALNSDDLPEIAATAQAQTDSALSSLRADPHPFPLYPLLRNQVGNVVFHVAGRIPGTNTQVPFPAASELTDGRIHIIFNLG